MSTSEPRPRYDAFTNHNQYAVQPGASTAALDDSFERMKDGMPEQFEQLDALLARL